MEKQNKCHYCDNMTEIPRHFVAMCIPVPRIEALIDKWGRKNWFENLTKKPSTFTPKENNELEEMVSYDQLLNTIGKGYMCEDCIKLEGELHEKYYPVIDKKDNIKPTIIKDIGEIIEGDLPF